MKTLTSLLLIAVVGCSNSSAPAPAPATPGAPTTSEDGGGGGQADGGGDGGAHPSASCEDTKTCATGSIDRMGRPAINTALNLSDDVMKDAYNQESSIQDWAKNTKYDLNFEKNLEIFDKLDGNVEWTLTNGVHPLRDALKTDVLIVDTGKKCDSTNAFCEGGYLEIEAELLLGGPAHTTCGGRTLNEDIIDKTLTLLVTKGKSAVSDGVSAATKPSTHTFPYLANPN